MTDTVTGAKQTGANQYCGSCGAVVRSYWSSCAACKAPLEVTPVASYAPSESESMPPPPARSAYTAPAATSGYASAPPAWSARDEAPSTFPSTGVVASTSGYVAPSTGVAASTSGYVAPSPGFAASPSDISADSAYPSTTAFPVPSYQSLYQRDDAPARSAGRSRAPWLVTVIALIVLLVGAGGFAGYNATKLSSANSHLSDTKAQLASVQKQLATANSSLNQAQSQLSDARATNASQGAEIGAYKTCISDLNAAGTAIRDNNESAFNAAEALVQTDCLTLGVT